MGPRISSFGWVGVALALCAAYALALPPQPAELPDGVLTLSQAHRVAGEDFLLAATPPRAVLVGSSLSAVLPARALRPLYNLALSGGSALTGLQLAAYAARPPERVFIEANVLERPADRALLDELTQPVLLRLKARCAACRTRNQPLTVALATLSRWRLHPLSDEDQERVDMAARQTLRPQAFAIQLEGARQPVDPGALDSRMAELGALVERLERLGTRITFVEMPVHPAIAAQVHQRAVVDAVRRRFPAGRYGWMEFRDRDYGTTDGVHLTYRAGRSVAQALAAASALPGAAD